MRGITLFVGLGLAGTARADSLPIVTLTELGPTQQIPTDRSFYIAGDIAPTVEAAQAIVVRKGSSSMFGDDGQSCRSVLLGLHLASASTADVADDDDDEETVEINDEGPVIRPRFQPGLHTAFEVFPSADSDVRDADVLVSAAWQRNGDAKRYQLLVPHDREMFSTGYNYCLFVVLTERVQEIDDQPLADQIDSIARNIVACGDKSSCQDEALDDFEARIARMLASSRSLAAGPANETKTIAAQLKQAARESLGEATGIIEARDHIEDRWEADVGVATPMAHAMWADVSTDSFAHAVATLLARSGALLPQVRPAGKQSAISLFTPDGKLRVGALQILDDGRSIRVAESRAPSGAGARVLTATTDTLVLADGVTLYDLIQLGRRHVHVDKEWTTLKALGDRVSSLGLATWTAEDTAYLAAATAQMKRLADYVDLVTGDATCDPGPIAATEDEETPKSVRRHLGEWLACQQVDGTTIEALAQQLDELVQQDQSWKATRDKLVARAKKIVTVTTTAPASSHVAFSSAPWVFSYVTPIVGYAGVLAPDASFGLFYLGAQIHLDPNPIDDVLWRDGVTPKDLRRALALELGVAPYGGSFGPDHRYSGPGTLPPLFFGIALHIVPYTSLTFGGSIVDRKRSTVAAEQASTIVAPYVGITVQLNLPDLLRVASHPSSDTEVTP